MQNENVGSLFRALQDSDSRALNKARVLLNVDPCATHRSHTAKLVLIGAHKENCFLGYIGSEQSYIILVGKPHIFFLSLSRTTEHILSNRVVISTNLSKFSRKQSLEISQYLNTILLEGEYFLPDTRPTIWVIAFIHLSVCPSISYLIGHLLSTHFVQKPILGAGGLLEASIKSVNILIAKF